MPDTFRSINSLAEELGARALRAQNTRAQASALRDVYSETRDAVIAAEPHLATLPRIDKE